MGRVSPIQTNFDSGEFSPLLHGRVDIGRYRSALDTCLNFIPTLQGGIVRRPGTKYVSEVKTSTSATRLVSFQFSVTQAYVLEFGDQYIRFYRNNGQIESGGSPYEISTGYLAADLFDLKFTQSADVLYIVHPDYPPATLSRTGHTSWTLADMDFLDGPYTPLNATGTTMTPAATFGVGFNITASSVVGLNGGDGFQATDVGRWIRIQHGTTWGYAEITSVSSTTVAVVTAKSNFGATTASGFWRMSLWSATTGYPSTVTFHEDRLAFAGTPGFTQRVDLSESGVYNSFSPTEPDSTVKSDNALSFTFNANDVNAVRWMVSDEKGLVVGTAGGEWIVRPSSSAEALTPTNITAKRSTTYGSADIQGLQVGKSVLFVQRSGRKIRELSYYFDVDGFRATDVTQLAEHITESGIKEMAHKKEPQPILWCVRQDGVLTGMTYERDVDGFKAGWHRHNIGGVSDAGGTVARVESVASIPSADGSRDEVWLIVQRYVDGAVFRSVEYMERLFDDETLQEDAFFVDSGLTYDDPLTITGITTADPAVVTATAHGFSDGDKVLIKGVIGISTSIEGSITSSVNGNSYLVANSTTNTFELTDLEGNNVDFSAVDAYVSGGEVRKFVTTISGLSHLEGESVTILADGAVQPNKIVSSGSITLQTAATKVHIGYGYNSDLKLLRTEGGASDGTSMGKTRRIQRVGVMFHRSLGLKMGPSFTDLTTLTFRSSSDPLTRAPALFTGIRSDTVEFDYDFDNQLCIRQFQPLPTMILAVMLQMVTNNR